MRLTCRVGERYAECSRLPMLVPDAHLGGVHESMALAMNGCEFADHWRACHALQKSPAFTGTMSHVKELDCREPALYLISDGRYRILYLDIESQLLPCRGRFPVIDLQQVLKAVNRLDGA